MLLVLLACRSSGEGGPRDIVLGVDVCERCHMIIDDETRAAQWVDAEGGTHVFDEAGELVAWLAEGERGEGRAFVADAGGAGWVAAEAASFVHGAVGTPMGFDVVAYQDRARADSLAAARGGVVLAWAALLKEGVAGADAR
jgi:copper chaperone NosL